MDKTEEIKKLIESAKYEIARSEQMCSYNGEQTAALCAIANSLTAIAMIMTPTKVTMYGSEQARWLNGE